MSRAESYAREINSLNTEIKRLNGKLKSLREQKKKAESNLYYRMQRDGSQKIEGITIKSVTPKERKKRKPISQKKADAIDLFKEIGVTDPEDFWEEFQATQTYAEGEESLANGNSKKTSKKNKKKDEYDPSLGY